MYEPLIAALRNVSEYDSGYAKLMYDAADAIEAQDRHILTLQREMMAEAECHIADVERLNKQIEELQADVRPVVRGKWTLNKDGSGTCSECGRTQKNCWDLDNWDNFCHFCGADMMEES